MKYQIIVTTQNPSSSAAAKIQAQRVAQGKSEWVKEARVIDTGVALNNRWNAQDYVRKNWPGAKLVSWSSLPVDYVMKLTKEEREEFRTVSSDKPLHPDSLKPYARLNGFDDCEVVGRADPGYIARQVRAGTKRR